MNLMRYKILYFIISLVFLVPGMFSLLLWGLKPSIDFTGGSLLEVETRLSAFLPDLQDQLNNLYELESVQQSAKSNILLRGKEINNQQKQEIILKLQELDPDLQELRFETVGPILGRELLNKTIIAVILVIIFILSYVAYQFKNLKYGVCAILAMFHDSLILIGSFSLLGHFFNIEINILFVTALLTTLSFSIHDTIVVFDRIRELGRKHAKQSPENIINAAVIETLSRSINNSITIIIMLLALVLLGGESIRWFAVALLIGAITGTYSSTFTAAPLLLLWDEVKKRLKK